MIKTIGKLGLTLCLAATLSFGRTWSAKVIDASCYDTRKAAHQTEGSTAKVCAPTASTTNFAIQTSTGKVYKVDSTGNSRLAGDIQSGALKKDHDGDIHAMVTGKLKSGVLTLNSVVVTK